MIETQRIRAFQISCGLREGYSESSTLHHISEARHVITQWIEERMAAGSPVAVGILMSGEFIYPWTEKGVISSRHEDAFVYRGRVQTEESDDIAKEMLQDLAMRLAKALKQQRVHAEFCGESWVVES